MRKIFSVCCAKAPAQPKANVKAIAKIPTHFEFSILDFRLFTDRDCDWIIFLTTFSAIQNPKSQIQNSFYDLIRSRQHVGRNRKADLFRCLHVDYKLKLRRLLNRQVGRLGTLEDLVHVAGGAPIQIGSVAP